MELVLILFTTNTWIMLKKTNAKESFNYQTILDYWSYEMAANVKNISIKNHSYYFFNDIINFEDFNSNLLKIEKSLVFTTLDTSQLKKTWWLWKYSKRKSFPSDC